MPVDRVGDPVDVLLELPDQPALADASRSGDRDQPDPPIAPDSVEQLLQLAQLLVAADEWRFEGIGPSLSAPLRDHAEGKPRRNRRRLALEGVVADRLEHDGPFRRPHGGFADEHGARLGHALQAGRGVDEVAGHHPLVCCAQRYGRLSGQDPGASPKIGMQAADRVDELERGPDGALRVVLVRDRRAPDGHDGVADELLDRAAVEVDDLGRGVEVAGEELADRLRIAVLRQRREADQVGEEDRDQASLGGRDAAGGFRGRVGTEDVAARPAESRVRPVRLAARRTVGGERAAAVVAEAIRGRVLGSARRADHACCLGLNFDPQRTRHPQAGTTSWSDGARLGS